MEGEAGARGRCLWEGACGKAGVASFPVEVASSPVELAFSRVEKSYLPGYTSRDLPLWAAVVWVFFSLYIFSSLGNNKVVREWEGEEQDVDFSIHVSWALGMASGPG